MGRAERAYTSEVNADSVCRYVDMYVDMYVINRPVRVPIRVPIRGRSYSACAETGQARVRVSARPTNALQRRLEQRHKTRDAAENLERMECDLILCVK